MALQIGEKARSKQQSLSITTLSIASDTVRLWLKTRFLELLRTEILASNR